MATPLRLSRLPLRALPAAPRTALQHSYHSYTNPPPPGPFTPTETSILTSALPLIPTHGFTPTTLALGAKAAGYLDATTSLFPAGAFSLVHFWLYTQRNSLSSSLSSSTLSPVSNNSPSSPNTSTNTATKPPSLSTTIKHLTFTRLLANAPILPHYQSALALMSLAGNIPTSIRELGLLSDEIWFLANDKSVDSSWYTKRASLAAIYAASELYMTTDSSEGFRNTREFMERRFEDSRVLGKTLGGVGQWVGFTAGATVNVLRSKGVRI